MWIYRNYIAVRICTKADNRPIGQGANLLKTHPKRYSADERRHMIITALAIEIQRDRSGWLSCAEIGEKVAMSASPTLRGYLKDLCAVGLLTYREVERAGRFPGYEYHLTPGTYRTPKKRTIQFNHMGKSQGQMELGI